MALKLSPITKDQSLKIVKTAVYIALSGALTALITYAADNQALFGPLYVVVNLGLVTLKQALTPNK